MKGPLRRALSLPLAQLDGFQLAFDDPGRAQKEEWPLGTATQANTWEDWVPIISWESALVSSPFRVRASRSEVARARIGAYGRLKTWPRQRLPQEVESLAQ